MDYEVFKNKKIDDLKEKNLNQLIAEGGRSPSKSVQSKLINFRVDDYTANRLDSLSHGMRKNKTTIFKAALLAFKNLSPDDRLKLIGEIAN